MRPDFTFSVCGDLRPLAQRDQAVQRWCRHNTGDQQLVLQCPSPILQRPDASSKFSELFADFRAFRGFSAQALAFVYIQSCVFIPPRLNESVVLSWCVAIYIYIYTNYPRERSEQDPAEQLWAFSVLSAGSQGLCDTDVLGSRGMHSRVHTHPRPPRRQITRPWSQPAVGVSHRTRLCSLAC